MSKYYVKSPLVFYFLVLGGPLQVKQSSVVLSDFRNYYYPKIPNALGIVPNILQSVHHIYLKRLKTTEVSSIFCYVYKETRSSKNRIVSDTISSDAVDTNSLIHRIPPLKPGVLRYTTNYRIMLNSSGRNLTPPLIPQIDDTT